MRTNPTPSSPRQTVTPTAPAERRNRTRLRDLCDEVLASFRAASSRETISEQDRRDSMDILAAIAPLSRR
ncbi:MAG: hypothetical protein JWN79_3094 [Gemmatimonadetes bacterium]|jgi:hypothetical protein|nr:hypothetical protein [Gemmatimonadota bacterium]